VQSDNGTEFVAANFTAAIRKWTDAFVKGRVYKPSTQGAVENQNKKVRKAIKNWCAQNKTADWYSGLPEINRTSSCSLVCSEAALRVECLCGFACRLSDSMNSAYHATIKNTPFTVAFGQKPRPWLAHPVQFATSTAEIHNPLVPLQLGFKRHLTVISGIEIDFAHDKTRCSRVGMPHLFSATAAVLYAIEEPIALGELRGVLSKLPSSFWQNACSEYWDQFDISNYEDSSAGRLAGVQKGEASDLAVQLLTSRISCNIFIINPQPSNRPTAELVAGTFDAALRSIALVRFQSDGKDAIAGDGHYEPLSFESIPAPADLPSAVLQVQAVGPCNR